MGVWEDEIGGEGEAGVVIGICFGEIGNFSLYSCVTLSARKF